MKSNHMGIPPTRLYNPQKAIAVGRKLSQLATTPPAPAPAPALPEVPLTYTLCELVEQNRALLLQASEQGHRFKDIQAVFSQLGLSISESTFYRYLRKPEGVQSSQPDTAALSDSPVTHSTQLSGFGELSPSPHQTPEAIVTTAFESIQGALAAGYTFTEIARIFQAHHVKLSVRQLKREYLKFEASQQAAVVPAVNAPVSTTTASAAALELVTTVSAAALELVSASLTVKLTDTEAQTDALTIESTAPAAVEPTVESTESGTDLVETASGDRKPKAKTKRTVSSHVSLADRKRHQAKRAATRAALASKG